MIAGRFRQNMCGRRSLRTLFCARRGFGHGDILTFVGFNVPPCLEVMSSTGLTAAVISSWANAPHKHEVDERIATRKGETAARAAAGIMRTFI